MSILDLTAVAITAVFLLIVISYYVLLLLPRRKPAQERRFSSITIIIPARNEERHIADCIASVQAARFKGRKQIIVVDDASTDKTAKIAATSSVTLLHNKEHLGKSHSLNKALKRATGELIAIVDADSTVDKHALAVLAEELSRHNVAGATVAVKVSNRKSFVNPWVHLELLYGSLMRSIMSKINANIVTPGPLSMYRKDALQAIGGFSTQGYSEDMDVAVRLIRKGYRISFSDHAAAYTHMPARSKDFLRQRLRMARGLVYLLKRNLQLNRTAIDLYTLPLFLFTYVQAVIMSCITLYKIGSGYAEYFASQGVYLSWSVVKFFVEWLSIAGFLRWAWSIATGAEPLTLISAIGIISTMLTYPLFLYAIIKYDKRIDLLHLLPLAVMFPFWLLLMLLAVVASPEWFAAQQYNRWKKNE